MPYPTVSEILPSGLRAFNCELEDICLFNGHHTIKLTRQDIDRLYGLIHPTVVHGCCQVKTPDDER